MGKFLFDSRHDYRCLTFLQLLGWLGLAQDITKLRASSHPWDKETELWIWPLFLIWCPVYNFVELCLHTTCVFVLWCLIKLMDNLAFNTAEIRPRMFFFSEWFLSSYVLDLVFCETFLSLRHYQHLNYVCHLWCKIRLEIYFFVSGVNFVIGDMRWVI